MQFQVPQNVTMEDRIAGPLTVTQFVIVVVGGFIAFFIFNMTFLSPALARIAGIGFGIFTAVIALGKFNDQPLYRFFPYLIAFVRSPKTRIWHKSTNNPNLIKAAPPKKQQATQRVVKRVTKNDIANLAAVIDSRGRVGVVQEVNQPDKK